MARPSVDPEKGSTHWRKRLISCDPPLKTTTSPDQEEQPAWHNASASTASNESDRTDPHERISNVGGPNADRTRWKLTEDAAIAGIEAGKWAFYVERPVGQVVDVVIATRLGRKYLKTTADGERPDNLLSLPECG